ncbi:MAG TPA: hypothetical protein VF062_14620 [Candidatus Limnocylindrales bacterium]
MTTWLGPFGNLREFKCPPPHPVAMNRGSAVLVTLGGMAKIQRAPRGSRSLTWTFEADVPADLRELIALELGVHGAGPFWWYDPLSAGLQMLPVAVASPGLGGDELFGTSGTATLDYATVAPFSLGVTGSGEAESPVVPVFVGRAYVAAAQVSADARLRLRWVDSAGATLSTTDGATGTTRRTVTGTAPASSAGVKVVLDPTSSVAEVEFSQLQLTEGSSAITWEPGPGMARWSIVGGLEQVYQLADSAAADYRRDLAVSLIEAD